MDKRKSVANSSSSSSEDSDRAVGNKITYKTKKKVFCYNWLNNEKLKHWLEPVKDTKNKCKCTACGKIITCGKSELEKHAETLIHKRNMSKIKFSGKINDMFSKATTEKKEKILFEKKVKNAEIVISSYIAEHNTAFSNVEHLIEMLKKVLPDSKILQEVKLKRKKCTAIIKNVIAKVETEDLINILQTEHFSILIDETTDISTEKLLCIVVQYIHPIHKQSQVQLLELLRIDSSDGSADKLYGSFVTYMTEKKIPLTNIVGLACDGAAVMVGKHNSFFSRLKQDVPHAVLLKCICHSAALVASKACNKIPGELEDLIKNIYTYVGASSKRCDQLKEMQDYFQLKHSKILKLSGTRWLATHQCIERTLENWDVLISYFTIAVYEDKLNSAKFILENLKNDKIKCYFLFLKYSLNYLNQFNALFQSKSTLIDILQKESIKLYLQIGQNFLKSSILKSEYLKGNILHPSNYLPLDKIFVGYDCDILLKTLNASDQSEIRKNILEFYVAVATEIMSRLPINNKLFSEFEFVTPSIALSNIRNNELNTLPNICKTYENIVDVNTLLYEWRTLSFQFSDDEKHKLSQLNKVEMWLQIFEMQDFTGKYLFKNIGKIALIVLTLPHSNAESERVFSIVTDIKTKKRNKIGADSLNSVCVVRTKFKAEGINCTNFIPKDEHFKKFNQEMYNHNLPEN